MTNDMQTATNSNGISSKLLADGMHREAFEKWFAQEHLEYSQRTEGGKIYVAMLKSRNWEGWQAAMQYRDELEKGQASVNHKINDGGPAYPFTEHNGDGSYYTDHSGVTLRDYFAAKVLASAYTVFMDAVDRNQSCPPDWRIGLAIDSYAMADAMLKAREERS